MSEYTTPEVLSESDRLPVVLEHLKYLEERYKVLEESEDAPEDLEESLHSTVEELSDLLMYKELSVSGYMMLPTLDEYGHVIGEAYAHGTQHGCTLTGLSVLGTDINEIFTRGTIVLQFEYGSISHDTYVESSDITYKTIFPVSQCSMHVVDELNELMLAVQPEDDDPIAHDIDAALHNSPIDLADLADLIHVAFPNLNDLQREMYLHYLHRTGNMDGREVLVAAQQFTLYGLHDGEADELEFTTAQDLNGPFQGFSVDQVVDDEGTDHYLLSILVYSPDLDGVASIRIQDINEVIFV